MLLAKLVIYLQYTGNEAAIAALASVIKRADTEDLYGDVGYFYIDTDTLISQAAVDEHVATKAFGNWGPMFITCNGTMTFDPEPYRHLTPRQVASKLDDDFYHCRIGDLFGQGLDHHEDHKGDCDDDD